MTHWPEWIRKAVTPSQQEVDRVASHRDDSLADYCRDQTDPSDTEVDALVRRLMVGQAAPAWRWQPWVASGGLGMAVAAAAAVMIWFVSATPYGPIELALSTPVNVQAETVYQFGPSIKMRANADVNITQADEEGTVVVLEQGETHFDVQPDGEYRDLQIRAGEVLVSVKGTIFDVKHVNEVVEVSVTRGLVAVLYRGKTIELPAGKSWSNRNIQAANDASVDMRVAATSTSLPHANVPSESPPALTAQTPHTPSTQVGTASQPVMASPSAPSLEANATDLEPPQAMDVAATPTKPIPSIKDSSSPKPHTDASQPAATNRLDEETAAKRLISQELQEFNALLRSREKGVAAAELLPNIQAFLKKWPDSRFVATAEELRVQCLIEGNDPAKAIVALDNWLSQSRSNHQLSATAEATYRLRRATLLRSALNDCDRARADYKFVSQTLTGRARAEALAWYGLCDSSRQPTAASRTALEEALKSRLLDDGLKKRVSTRLQDLRKKSK